MSEELKFSVEIGLVTNDITTTTSINKPWTVVFHDKIPSDVCVEEAAKLLRSNLKATLTEEFLSKLFKNHQRAVNGNY